MLQMVLSTRSDEGAGVVMAEQVAGKNSPIARRLRQLRLACGYPSSLGFAVFLGVIPQRLNAVENGAPLGIHLAQRIFEKTGATPDWLYNGMTGNLSIALEARLREAARKLEEQDPLVRGSRDKVKHRR